ncbi:meiosis regulator and mRNA stability factor 1 isoform X2 [Polypterus senegalus]|uniref:meiosis regulator and mRNA stability factor 1 isoform X2 n=1 Tax=Polypterus senegalus TaxID=55291 RepID=UPI0019626008|nr:meiosis regulator and mRNA stability factor 1 isoform X2 [Polypterus senegalus]
MMEGMGKESPLSCRRPFRWLNHSENNAHPCFWKFSDCFSSYDQPSPFSKKTTDYMENRKPVLELKDVPPPPHHAASNPFPALSIPGPASCFQSAQQESPRKLLPQPDGPQVSVCAHCEGSLQVQHGGSNAGLFNNIGGGSSTGGGGGTGCGVSLHINKPLDTLNGSTTGTITCQVGSTINPPLHSLRDPYPRIHGAGCEMPHHTGASSQSLGTQQHLPCCAGLLSQLHPFSSKSSSFGQSSLHLPLSSGVLPSHSGHVAHSGCYSCEREFGPGARLEPLYSTHDDLPTTTLLCANPLHMNAEHTLFLKGTHYCRDCLRKPARPQVSDSVKVWPNIPPPSAQSAPIPMCNGCGVPGTAADGVLLLGSSLGKETQKYGSPDLSAQENLPPIGVFWDIENCSVPSGRSAMAVVQRIRERFFKGHREAEFICVCDISKENKEVIQELNNSQVTVAHINATAKNAADDKLRQSLRRFADTHTAPATVVLVSSDVNFASELSDLRHRHGFQVILVHKNQASDALLQHANTHVTFEDFVSDLPPRVLVKVQPCNTLLYIYNLPANRDGKSVSNRLRRLSDNCGGKVLSISSGIAVLRFSSRDAAERAFKRMENEDVFGNKISVSFIPPAKVGPEIEPGNGPASSSCSSSSQAAEKPRSPKRVGRTTRLCQNNGDPTDEQSYSPRKGANSGNGSAGKNIRVKSLQELCTLESKQKLNKELDRKTRNETPSPQTDLEPTSSVSVGSKCAAGIGEQSSRAKRRDCSTPRSITDSPVEKTDKTSIGSVGFHISTPSAFSKLTLQRTTSPLVLSQGSWSSRSGSPSLSNRSSPAVPTLSSACPDPFSSGMDIHVTNLDYRMSRKELHQVLHDAFSKYGQVVSLELSPHTDYQLRASVQMGTLQEAISAVSGLHRYKMGSRRIQVSLVTGTNKSLSLLSSETVSILQDAPACCLPLFKFTEIYEKKFGRKLAISDLYKLTDVVAVRDQGNTRLICLLPSSQARQSPLGSSLSHDGSSANCSPVVFEELEYHEPICKQHSTMQNFSESDFDPDSYKIPFVVLSLKSFAAQVHSLLQSHEGTLPLLSFPDCYASEFSSLSLVEEGEGVSLEHLITCIPGINIVTAQNGIKVVKWIHNKPPPPNSDAWIHRCKSPIGNPQLIQFSREVIDMMKNQPSCVIPISKFIPLYHYHFAKQCRVSDYGYSKLLELLEAVPHVLQILGMGSKLMLTLTHRAQVKRFTQDLLKLLKSQASKHVVIRDFVQAYHWCFSKDWNVINYGVCELMDLLTEIPDTTVCVSHQDGDVVISMPKRERTQDELERTKHFAKEVVDLLRHQPHFRMSFSKFIPSYHHHFGRQCKLTYYGFNKLLELFEAIPDVLQVLECGEEKILALTEVEKVKALAAQLVKLLRSQKDNSLPITDLMTEYCKTFGYGLRLQDFDVSSVSVLLQKLCHVVKVVDTLVGREVQLINRKSLRSLTTQLLVLLMSHTSPSCSLSLNQLIAQYEFTYGSPLNPCEYGFVSLGELLKSLPNLVEIFMNEEEGCPPEECVRLTRLYEFARSARALLHTYHYQQIFLSEFPSAFCKYTGKALHARTYGYTTVEELLCAIPQVVWIKGHGHKKIVVLKNDMKARTSPLCLPAEKTTIIVNSRVQKSSDVDGLAQPSTPRSGSGQADPELMCLSGSSPVDLLCGPVPSCLPSPQLHPDPVVLEHIDLIRFEEQPSQITGMLVLTDDEKILGVAATTIGSDAPPLDTVFTGSISDPRVSQPPNHESPETLKTIVTESPAKRSSRSKVKLAANFSFTPVTRL